MAQATHLLWLDLETTGTDETADPILEIGVVLTTAEAPFAELARDSVVIGGGLAPDWRDRMVPVVVEMHTVNGLLEDVAESVIGATDAAQRVIDNVLAPHTRKHAVMLAGSGVGHFDRRFIAAQMPALDGWLQYPCLDVGVLRRAVRFAGRDDLIPREGDHSLKPHRALDDVLLHLDEWRHYATIIDNIPTT